MRNDKGLNQGNDKQAEITDVKAVLGRQNLQELRSVCIVGKWNFGSKRLAYSRRQKVNSKLQTSKGRVRLKVSGN